jgi:pimeloyl-ACP methyl ester carboxylesterase
MEFGDSMIIHQCISGFTQNVGYLHGVMKLSERLRKHSACDCHGTRVELNTWKSDWKQIAEYYWLLSEFHFKPLTLCVYAYSWGCGWGAMELARNLKNANIRIRAMVLCDPVFRHPEWYMRWKSIVHRDSKFEPVIKIPDNVEEVFSFYQTVNRPGGHKLVADGNTTIHPSIHVKDTIHQKMDDNWKFHLLSLEVANRVNKGLSLSMIDIDQLDATKLLI